MLMDSALYSCSACLSTSAQDRARFVVCVINLVVPNCINQNASSVQNPEVDFSFKESNCWKDQGFSLLLLLLVNSSSIAVLMVAVVLQCTVPERIFAESNEHSMHYQYLRSDITEKAQLFTPITHKQEVCRLTGWGMHMKEGKRNKEQLTSEDINLQLD